MRKLIVEWFGGYAILIAIYVVFAGASNLSGLPVPLLVWTLVYVVRVAMFVVRAKASASASKT